MGLKLIRRLGFVALFIFYTVAGLNHFLNHDFYLPLIPDYLVYKSAINCTSGLIEMLLALAMLVPKFRKPTSYLIILMLLAFIPSHWHFIVEGGCMEGSICVPLWVAWLRLIIIHPILIWWAWKYRDFKW